MPTWVGQVVLGFLLTLSIALYAGINKQVDINSNRLSKQEAVLERLEKQLDRIENKVDKINP